MRLYELLTEKDPEDRRTLPPGFKYDDAGKMVIDRPEYVKQMKILKKERGDGKTYKVDADFGNKHKDFYLYVDQIQDTFEKTVAPLRNELSSKYVEQWTRQDLDKYQTRLDGLARIMGEFVWRVENARQETPDAIPQEGAKEIEATYNRIYKLLTPKMSSIHDNKTLQKHGAYYGDKSRTTPSDGSRLQVRGRVGPGGDMQGEIGVPDKEPTIEDWKKYFKKRVGFFVHSSQNPQPPKKNIAWYNNRQIQPIGNNPPMTADQEPIGSSNPKNLKGGRPSPGGKK